jgi:hypothetical protein
MFAIWDYQVMIVVYCGIKFTSRNSGRVWFSTMILLEVQSKHARRIDHGLDHWIHLWHQRLFIFIPQIAKDTRYSRNICTWRLRMAGYELAIIGSGHMRRQYFFWHHDWRWNVFDPWISGWKLEEAGGVGATYQPPSKLYIESLCFQKVKVHFGGPFGMSKW